MTTATNQHDSVNLFYEWLDKNSSKPEIYTETLRASQETEEKCLPLLASGDAVPGLLVDKHRTYLKGMLRELNHYYTALDATRPFMVFWALNGLALLDFDVASLRQGITSTILSCQHPDGGIGGGFGQSAHLAPTYGGIQALALSGDTQAWDQIDRQKMYKWLLTLKQPDGSFRVCKHGEVDPRGTYCALSVASLLNILTPELTKNVGSYIQSCQTHEGGFANFPTGEAHGGYAFCAIASLYFVNPDDIPGTIANYVNVPAFLGWLTSLQQQQPKVAGLAGRTNKLVDGCYSFWVGGCWALIEQALSVEPLSDVWSRQGLHEYILCCCQNEKGGLRDKPGASPDAYHSNYVLCGLASTDYKYKLGKDIYDWRASEVYASGVKSINPVFGLREGVSEAMNAYFTK